jgi:multidrug efflux pump subunit AcrA (membrane-fusion protein)
MHTEVDVPNPNGVLLPGVYAEATLMLDRQNNVLAVPQEAVNILGDQRSVWVVDPSNKVEERKVSTGIETPNDVEVLSGLHDGELVTVGDRSSLTAGEVVRPKEITPIQGSSEPGQSQQEQ